MVAGPPFVVPVAVPRTVRINESFPGPPPGAASSQSLCSALLSSSHLRPSQHHQGFCLKVRGRSTSSRLNLSGEVE
ncbi:hypothetical protein HW555_010102 [Spodoptera exigua]|uniref:Uncharacterized protein n=1 Tax=Spodoptera exigua TaxID=7107 RepID=A0A835GA17_SPOEX|nr:hypothetical protein HW555_010102 [Spodoptera exigua]